MGPIGEEKKLFFFRELLRQLLSWTKHFCLSGGGKKSFITASFDWVSFQVLPNPSLLHRLFSSTHITIIIVTSQSSRSVRGQTLSEGADQMLHPQLRLCLATGVRKWKGKSVTQWSPAASFSSAPIYTFWKHQSRSVAELNCREKDTEGWGGRIQKPFLTSNWLPGGPVQLSRTWIMHGIEGEGGSWVNSFP